MSTIEQNFRIVRENIAEVCTKHNRQPEEIEIVAVSKTKPAEIIDEAIRAGIQIIGENRVQEAKQKTASVSGSAIWHMVGHLQTNKVRKALKIFDLIQSVDSLHLAEVLDSESIRIAKTTDILIQVNTSGEASKFGVEPTKTIELIEHISTRLNSLRILGLMTIGLFTSDVNKIRPCFIRLRKLSEDISIRQIPNVKMQYLSMGMTEDYKIAIEEGANMVRLGRVLFGERNS
ncbi:MAG: YggS family pyridoxal phosphate-dependent enzyme [bacterium]